MIKKIAAFLTVLLTCFFFSDCGKKGALLPPFVRTPQEAGDLAISQRGDVVFVSWKNPVKYADGSPLDSVSQTEIWVFSSDQGDAATAKVTAKNFEDEGKLAAAIGADQLPKFRKEIDSDKAGFSYPYSLAGTKIGAVSYLFSIRVKDRRSHESPFSNPISFRPQLVPLPPKGLEARFLEDKIELKWQTSQANIDQSVPAKVEGYNIYKELKNGSAVCLNSTPVRDPAYEDISLEFGVPARYFVRATATATAPYFESADSESIEVLPKDIFPPTAPTGLIPVVGLKFIALSWEANKDKDFAGYYVRRRTESETEFILLTPQPILENAFTDIQVKKGRRYHYAVSSLDRNGNESARTEIMVDSSKKEVP